MAECTKNIRKRHAGIRCVEVVISRKAAGAGDQYLWPLSVYSLENQAVAQPYAEHGREVFHFMVYDWERTIERLLLEAQVPYEVIQYFIPEQVCQDLPMEERGVSWNNGNSVDATLRAIR